MKCNAFLGIWAALVCLTALALSCNRPGETSLEHVSGMVTSLGEQRIGFPEPDVVKEDFTCVLDTTPKYLQGTSGAGSPKPLVSYIGKVNAKDLGDKLEAITVNTGEKRGLVIHYGLEDSGTDELKVRFGLELAKMVPAGDHWMGKYWRTEPVTGGFLEETLNAVDKEEWYEQYGEDYASWIRIRRTNKSPNFSTFVKGQDVEHYTFFYEGAIKEFLAQNSGMDTIQIHAMAEPMLREQLPNATYEETGWRQILCLVGQNSAGQPMLDNEVTNGSPFLNKGLDLGSPCPPLCKGAVHLKQGMAVHPDCP